MEHFGIFAYVGRGSDETHPLTYNQYLSGVRFIARLYAGEKLLDLFACYVEWTTTSTSAFFIGILKFKIGV